MQKIALQLSKISIIYSYNYRIISTSYRICNREFYETYFLTQENSYKRTSSTLSIRFNLEVVLEMFFIIIFQSPNFFSSGFETYIASLRGAEMSR